jgi:myo-inositol-1-phosphate synthase
LSTNGNGAGARDRLDGAATNGKARYQHDKVRVAIIGVGNCANSFVQGVHHYRDADPKERVPGLMHVDLGGYHVSDIEFTCAFDVNKTKVGKDLGEAIWADPNNTIKFTKLPKKLGIPVYRGMTHDGIGKYAAEKITKAPGETADIVSILKETHTDVVVSYLPVGSEQATKWYVEQVLEAGCAFVNCIPVFIAARTTGTSASRRPACRSSATTSSRRSAPPSPTACWPASSTSAASSCGAPSQLNVGGNMDFFNMLERERLESKKISKTNAVTSVAGLEMNADDVHVGPSDYVPWLTDRKWAHIRLEGEAFGGVPLNAELKLEVWDSPNSAGIVIDAVRCLKLALNHGVSGQLDGPSSYLMKSPHNQRPDDEARDATEKFIAKYARKPGTQPKGRKARLGRPRRRRSTDNRLIRGADGEMVRPADDRREEPCVACVTHRDTGTAQAPHLLLQRTRHSPPQKASAGRPPGGPLVVRSASVRAWPTTRRCEPSSPTWSAARPSTASGWPARARCRTSRC